MTSQIIAYSQEGRQIQAATLGPKEKPCFLVVGGVHGDEPEGATLVKDFLEELKNAESHLKVQMVLVPELNPDGLSSNNRTNGKGVDLNRNFPTPDWSPAASKPRYNPGPHGGSESETQGLIKIIEQYKPFLIVHCHTWEPQICYTGERSKSFAQRLGKNFGHPITSDIGYPTPGSLGQYCDLNLETPCICIELPEEVQRKKAWEMVGPNLMEIALNGP